MSGILPPDVAYSASRAQSQAIAEYLGAGGSADDTSTEGIPLLHLVLSASRRYGLVIGDRLEGAVRAVLDGGPRDVDVRWRGRTPLHIAVGSCLTSTQVLSSFLPKQLNIIAMLVEAGADVNGRCEGDFWERSAGQPEVPRTVNGTRYGAEGQTPLMIAAAHVPGLQMREVGNDASRKCAIIRHLLTLGARVDICDDAGRTADSILGAHRLFVDTKFITRSQKEDVLKATKLVADVRAAGGTWTRYLHEPRVRLDVLRKLCCRGRATPQTYFFLGLPWTHMRARRRRQNLVACLFTELPADVFRHAIGFWRSDHDPPYSSNFPFR